MFEIKKENYSELSVCLKEIFELIEKVKAIKVLGKKYKLEYYLGGDYKNLLILAGMKEANAKESCIWCYANLKQDINRNEINVDSYPITRVYDPKDQKSKDMVPPIAFIKNKFFVIDTLHLLLRITDQLNKLLLLKLKIVDKVGANNLVNNINTRENTMLYLNFLREKCKISNPYYFSRRKGLQFRAFNGNEREKIFEQIFYKREGSQRGRTFYNIFGKNTGLDPDGLEFDMENRVWKSFYTLYNKIKKFNSSEMSIDILKNELKKWLDRYLYLSEYLRKSQKVTPYIHVFVFHVPEMLRLHQFNINQFNTQALERLNDFSSDYYRHCTNKNKSLAYIKQLINKRQRVEFLNLKGDFFDFHDLTSESENEDEDYDFDRDRDNSDFNADDTDDDDNETDLSEAMSNNETELFEENE